MISYKNVPQETQINFNLKCAIWLIVLWGAFESRGQCVFLCLVCCIMTPCPAFGYNHYDVIMGAIASQITSLTIVYSTVYSSADQSNRQSSASLVFVWGIHRGPVNSPHKWPVTRKMFPLDNVIMAFSYVNATGMHEPSLFSSHGGKGIHTDNGNFSTYRKAIEMDMPFSTQYDILIHVLDKICSLPCILILEY